MKNLRTLFLPFSRIAQWAATTGVWREFAGNPWRMAVWVTWTFIVPAWWYLLNPDAFLNFSQMSWIARDFGLPFFPGLMLIMATSLLGFVVATIDLTSAREHRFLAMANLPLVASTALVPVGLALGLIAIIQIAIGVGVHPMGALFRGGDVYAMEQATADPQFLVARDPLHRDAVFAQLSVGTAPENVFASYLDLAAWNLAQGRHEVALEQCARIRSLLPKNAAQTALHQKMAEIETLAFLRRGVSDYNARNLLTDATAALQPRDARRGLLHSWACLQVGDSSAARATLPDTASAPGASPWRSYPQLSLMPRIWAEDLSRALPDDSDRIRAILAHVETGL